MNKNGVILYTEFIAATLEMHGRVEEKRLAEVNYVYHMTIDIYQNVQALTG